MAGWTPAKAVNYRGVPFHPGAIAAFRAAGVNPPKALIAAHRDFT